MPYRILHIADVHLDMAFAGADARVGKRRREQLREAFERALVLARERNVDAVCIAGDLYEDGRSGADRAEYLRRVLDDLAPIRVFISPGNHDPFSASSIYHRIHNIPANVTIFDRRRFAPVKLADGLTLWGFAHEHAADRDPAIAGFACEGPGTHLLLFHGSDRDRMPPGKEAVAPFSAPEIERAGAQYAMVGHFHGMIQGARHAYPGSLEPHNFAQDGRHTVSLVTVDDHRVLADFIDVNRIRYVDFAFDVGPFGDRHALVDALRARLRDECVPDSTVYCRIRLLGEIASTLDFDLIGIESELSEENPGVTLLDECAAFDYDLVLREGRTVRSEFVRAMRDKIASAPDAERPLYENALRFGMLAFAGRKIPA
jgi:DNA repair protein SbcD/Mre11